MKPILVGLVLFFSTALQPVFADSFSPEDRLCAIRYMIVIKNMPEGHPQRQEYERRFFTSLDNFDEEFPDVEHEELVREINLGAQALYGQIVQGQVTSDAFWNQVITCDIQYGFTKTVKP